jgi:hypothetical protein
MSGTPYTQGIIFTPEELESLSRSRGVSKSVKQKILAEQNRRSRTGEGIIPRLPVVGDRVRSRHGNKKEGMITGFSVSFGWHLLEILWDDDAQETGIMFRNYGSSWEYINE